MSEATIIQRAEHPISRRDIDSNVLKVLYRLIGAGHVAYLVGGGVRDLMMGRRPKDFDIATSAHPQQIRELFRNSRLIGRRFRLVHVFFGAQNIEVATFRRRAEEVPDTDDPLIRHDNTFGAADEDAFRRDFTVNALFYSPATFAVIDYVNGVADLNARLIRTIGEPELRMREDPVRMIRAVRFAVKLGFMIEPATYEAMQRHRGDLVKAPAARLVEETFRTLEIIGAEEAFILMDRLGILELLLPFLSQHPLVEPEQTATVMILRALSDARRRGESISRPMLLAALYCPAYLAAIRESESGHRTALLDELRRRGFSRADTEQMRLLLDVLAHLATPSRALRRLVRRPYFTAARVLFELIAPALNLDPAAIERALVDPRPAAAGPPGRRRRRRHRGGRGGRRSRPRAAGESAANSGAVPQIEPITATPVALTGADSESADNT